MRRYVVVFEESAQADVRESFEWGCRVWGKKQAQQWARELRAAVSRQLSLVPRGFRLAPENEDFSEEIRQMIADNEIRDANTLGICATLAARGLLSLAV